MISQWYFSPTVDWILAAKANNRLYLSLKRIHSLASNLWQCALSKQRAMCTSGEYIKQYIYERKKGDGEVSQSTDISARKRLNYFVETNVNKMSSMGERPIKQKTFKRRAKRKCQVGSKIPER